MKKLITFILTFVCITSAVAHDNLHNALNHPSLKNESEDYKDGVREGFKHPFVEGQNPMAAYGEQSKDWERGFELGHELRWLQDSGDYVFIPENNKYHLRNLDCSDAEDFLNVLARKMRAKITSFKCYRDQYFEINIKPSNVSKIDFIRYPSAGTGYVKRTAPDEFEQLANKFAPLMTTNYNFDFQTSVNSADGRGGGSVYYLVGRSCSFLCPYIGFL